MHEDRTNAVELTAAELSEAQCWIADCEFGEFADLDYAARLDYLAELPAALITRTVASHYDGGLREFVRNTGLR